MNLQQFEKKIKSVKIGESSGLLKKIFGVKVSDSMPETYAKLKIKKLTNVSNVGDLVFFRLYLNNAPQMQCSIGVVTEVNENTFEYMTYSNGKNIKLISNYSLLKKDGNSLLGFYTLIK